MNSSVTYPDQYGKAAFDRIINEIQDSYKGQRTWTIFRASIRAGNLISAGYLDEREAERALVAAARTVGMVDTINVARQVANGMEIGKQKVRLPPKRDTHMFDGAGKPITVQSCQRWVSKVAATLDNKLRPSTVRAITAVAETISKWCIAMNSDSCRITMRGLAVQSGVSTTSVNRYIRIMNRHRLLDIVEVGGATTRGNRPSRVRMNLAGTSTLEPAPVSPFEGNPGLSGRSGGARRLILDILAQMGSAMSVTEIAASTKLSRTTIYRHLRVLVQHGIVIWHRRDGIILAGGRALLSRRLTELAHEQGIYGRFLVMLKRIERERQQWRDYINSPAFKKWGKLRI